MNRRTSSRKVLHRREEVVAAEPVQVGGVAELLRDVERFLRTAQSVVSIVVARGPRTRRAHWCECPRWAGTPCRFALLREASGLHAIWRRGIQGSRFLRGRRALRRSSHATCLHTTRHRPSAASSARSGSERIEDRHSGCDGNAALNVRRLHVSHAPRIAVMRRHRVRAESPRTHLRQRGTATLREEQSRDEIREAREDRIPPGMAKRVVDHLELVDVHHHE